MLAYSAKNPSRKFRLAMTRKRSRNVQYKMKLKSGAYINQTLILDWYYLRSKKRYKEIKVLTRVHWPERALSVWILAHDVWLGKLIHIVFEFAFHETKMHMNLIVSCVSLFEARLCLLEYITFWKIRAAFWCLQNKNYIIRNAPPNKGLCYGATTTTTRTSI